jgi:uncharacterized Zn finger protein
MVQAVAKPPVTADQDRSEFAPLSDDAIARQTDSGSFSRGKTYFRGKRIFNAVRRGNLLRARCRGSSGGPYHVEATLAAANQKATRNPVSYACNCPRGGFCKHVVALLLTWIDTPETFEVRPAIGELLAGKSQEELVALVEAMVARNPELESLIELPGPLPAKANGQPLDEHAIQREIATALGGSYDHDYDRDYGYRGYYGRGYDDYDEYGGGFGDLAKLERLLAIADDYAAAGSWQNVMLLAANLAEKLAPEAETSLDEHGDFATILQRTDAHLAACLAAQEELPADARFSDRERLRLIDAIYAIWEADLEIGGVDLSDGGPEAIGQYATAAELHRVRENLRALLLPAVGDPSKHQWHNRMVIQFLSLLKGEGGLSSEELLEEYRNAELWDEVVDLLLEMDRVEEAIGLAARKVGAANALLAFADRLRSSGGPERAARAISLVDDRLWEREGQRLHDDQVLREWLEKRYLEHGQPEKALALAESRFKTAPSKATYDAVKTAALQPGLPNDPWPELRPKLLAALAKNKSWYALIEIHIEEGHVREALDVLAKSEKPTRNGQPWGEYFMASPESYSARVAKAAEKEFPDEAVRIYQKLAEQKIALRGRPAYQEAASYLVLVMRLLEGNGRDEEWKGFITDLRAQNKSLRALREELDSLGLV